jgi:hypothetical protein
MNRKFKILINKLEQFIEFLIKAKLLIVDYNYSML